MEAENRTTEAFQSWAASYDKTVSAELERFAGVTHQQVLDGLLQRARVLDGGSVLDVGTGTGWAAIRWALENQDGQIVGLDMTPEMLKQITRNARLAGVEGRVQMVLASAMDLPYPDDHFEVVISSLALHHTEVPRALGEMVRVVKPGGRLAIADMGAPPAWRSAPISWLMALLQRAYKLVGGPEARADADAFAQTYTAEEWQGLLEARGLRNGQVTDILRPGQRIYPCVILASGEKGDASD